MIIAWGSLILGIIAGQLFPALNQFSGTTMEISIIFMLLIAGLEIGLNKNVFSKVRKIGFKILLIPLGTLIGSILGGALGGLFYGAVHEGMAVGVGMGFSPIMPVLLKGLATPAVITMAFFSNILRSMIARAVIPVLAKKLHYFAAVAPAGVTSVDTTLPLISKYTDSTTALVAIIHGMVLTIIVPILVPFFYSL